MESWEELSESEREQVSTDALWRKIRARENLRAGGAKVKFSLERHPGRPGKAGRPFVRQTKKRKDGQAISRTWWGNAEQEAIYRAAHGLGISA